MSSKAGAVTEQAGKAQGLVPKLRFPEFREAGQWDFKPLKALAKRKTKRNTDESIVRVLTNSAEQGVIDQKDYFDKDIAVQGNLESYFVVALGDFVYNPRVSSTAPVGPIGKNKIGLGVMSPLYTVFGFDGDDHFYEHFFRSSLWHSYMRFVSNSGARHDRMAISADDFMAMPVPAPLPAEQQKIADCLSSLDALIAAETEKLAALRDHKKGLMQQLFPAEGETVPRLRFPEFQNAGEWEEKPIGFACHLYQPETLSTSDLVPSGQFPVYGANGIIGRLDRYNHEESEIAVTCRGATCGEVLRTLPKAWINGNAMVVRPRSADLSSEFLFQFLKHDGLQSVVSGSAQPQITRAGFSPFLIKYPKESEQSRIVGCLSTIDGVIVSTSDRLNELKAHKSGLMKQLFPSFTEAAA
jgi:type I restriction enzyme S subunit